jgi:hypothetical protein
MLIREMTMRKPYSRDLRGRVVRAVEAGASCHEAAAAVEVSPSSAIRWVARRRQTGSVAAKPMGGKRSALDVHEKWLVDLIVAELDLTLEEIRGRCGRAAFLSAPVRFGGSSTAMTSRSKKSLAGLRIASARWSPTRRSSIRSTAIMHRYARWVSSGMIPI